MLKRLQTLWESLSHAGTEHAKRVPMKRNIVMTNRLVMILCLFNVVFAVYIFFNNPAGVLYALTFLVLLLLALVLNYFGYINVSRVGISMLVPVGVYIISLWTKSHSDTLYDINYISPRITILGSAVVPLMLFSIREIACLVFSLTLYILSLWLFDPIHDRFGVGYYQSGLDMVGYSYLNFSFIINLLIMISAALVLKFEIGQSQKMNDSLVHNLEEQNQEILTQAEELHSNQEKLTAAMNIISEQKLTLEDLNKDLLLNIKEKDSHLIHANRELATHNERLKQFSYGISHNLRAPVARVLGIAELLKLDFSTELLRMLTDSTRELDDVVKDFNKVIDLGNDIYSIKEKVSLEEEWLKVKSFLASSIGQFNDADIDADFSWCPVIFSIRPLINNIMFNLVSNAIKFRATDKKLKISITSNEDASSSFLIVRDNGIGFDEEEVRKDMFKMYKRFHTHVTGKGLGLHLVKIQVDILSGTIQVNSKRKIGTTFTIILPKATDLEFQLCFESEATVLYYNARVNALGIRWKRNVTLEELKETYLKCLEITQAYHTSNWIWEQHERMQVDNASTKWVLEHIMPQAIRSGLKKVAALIDVKNAIEFPITEIQTAAHKTGYEINFFNAYESATLWLSQED
jgi:signal transduction histidine kinase